MMIVKGQTIGHTWVLLPLQFFLIYNFCFAGVAVGAGRQGVVAYVNIGCYYLIGIPVGAILGYVAKLQVEVRNLYLVFKLRVINHQFP